MDPMTNPTPTPNSVPAPGAVPPMPSAPAGPAPVQPPVASVQPAAPVNPVVQPPVNPVVNPVSANPVFQPSGLNGVAATDPIMMPEPASAPDPVEEELKAPMKAAGPVPGSIGSAVSGPEAAESMPIDEGAFAAPAGSPQNVAFNDPAMQPEANSTSDSALAKPIKKKSSKTTLVALIIVAMMVVIALAVVLMIQLGVIQI